MVAADLQEVTGIVAANSSPPLELAALFMPFTYLLELDPVQHAAAFAAGVRVRGGGDCAERRVYCAEQTGVAAGAGNTAACTAFH